MRFLVELVQCDGGANERERAVISQVARHLGLDQAEWRAWMTGPAS